jgi:hypothetical protein
MRMSVRSSPRIKLTLGRAHMVECCHMNAHHRSLPRRPWGVVLRAHARSPLVCLLGRKEKGEGEKEAQERRTGRTAVAWRSGSVLCRAYLVPVCVVLRLVLLRFGAYLSCATRAVSCCHELLCAVWLEPATCAARAAPCCYERRCALSRGDTRCPLLALRCVCWSVLVSCCCAS